MRGIPLSSAEHPLRQLAIGICEQFEDLLTEKNIKVPDRDRQGAPEEAALYGEAWYTIEDSTTEHLARYFLREKKTTGVDDLVSTLIQDFQGVISIHKITLSIPDDVVSKIKELVNNYSGCIWKRKRKTLRRNVLL